MKLSEEIFGKELFQITEDDLKEYFTTPREETCLLEFKSGEIKINSILKEICAFLNTEGGLIIVGSPQERKVQKTGVRMKRICQGPLKPSHFKDKAWLKGIILSNIVPSPENLMIHEIPSGDGRCYIIEAPQSVNPPHQFLTDGRYYIRMEQEAKPAPHGIVEALFYKKKKAQLKVDIEISQSEEGAETFNNVDIQVSNTSLFPADHVKYLVEVYNISEIQENGSPIPASVHEKEHSFEIRGQSDEVLVDDRSLKLKLKVMNKLQPYIISVLAWNKEAGMYKYYTLFDPVNFLYIEKYHSGDTQKRSVEDFVTLLHDYTTNLDD